MESVALDSGLWVYRSDSGLVCWRLLPGQFGRLVGKSASGESASGESASGESASGESASQVAASARLHRWLCRLCLLLFRRFSAGQHVICETFDGGTCTAEGVNQSLRHRCSPLVRGTSAKCRALAWLERRVALVVQAHNRARQRRFSRRYASMQRKR
jgi:hypothetical protein